MQRHFARKGDKTTANGTVLEGEESFIQEGLPVAFHGAQVYCPACNSTGVILTTPPHHLWTVNGKQLALDGDLCVCKCSPSPRLLASQSSARMSFDSQDIATSAAQRTRTGELLSAAIAGLASKAKTSADDDYERMRQEAYGDPRYWTVQVGTPAPGTTTPAQTGELSGGQWVPRYPTSTSTSDLASPFRGYVEAFIAVLEAGGANISISATLRPQERAYLMHYSYAIAGGADPSSVPPMGGVSIDWVHRDANGNPDLSASQSAAQQMVSGYRIAYPPALPSLTRHSEGRAIDMTITNYAGKVYRNASGVNTTITNQSDLESLGLGYGVIKLRSDPPHWSEDGR